MAGYGPDKLNDPAKAEPVLQRMIQLDPADPANYFVLAKLYEDAGVWTKPRYWSLAKQARPNDPAVYMQLAGYYNRQGQFDKTIGALQERAAKGANQPEAFYTIATYYWDKAYRDARLKETEKKECIQRESRRSITPSRSSPTTWKRWSTRTCCSACRRTSRRIPPSSRRSSKQYDQLRKNGGTAQAEGHRRPAINRLISGGPTP